MIHATVNRQRFRIDRTVTVADTVNYLEMEFSFTRDWDGTEKWAHFRCGDAELDFPLRADDTIRAEDRLNLPAGDWEVFLHGAVTEDGETVRRITTEVQTLTVLPTGNTGGGTVPDIRPSATQYMHQTLASLRTDLNDTLSVYGALLSDHGVELDELSDRTEDLEGTVLAHESALASHADTLAETAEAVAAVSERIGAPSDEQLDAWFEAHPERTVSLPDGAVTEEKLHTSVRAELAAVGIPSRLATRAKTDLVAAVNEVVLTGNVREHRLANLEAAARGYLYREETDDTPSEVKQVPADAMPYASVNSIGAKTLVWNQLYPERAAGQQTRVGVTTAWSGRTVTLSGTATSTTTLAVTLADKIPVRAGHTYMLYLNCNTDFIRDTGTMFAELYRSTMGEALCKVPHNAPNTPAVGTAAADGLPYLYLYVINGQNYDGIVIEPVVIDLTRMFGAGMEPDAAQLAAMLPELLHAEPDPGTVRTYTVSAVKDETSGAEIAFPTESLFPGGMYGIGDASDELDLVRMTAVRRIGAVRAASLTWSENANHPHSFGARLTGVASHSIVTPANVLNTEYDTKPYRNLYYAEEKGIGVIADGGRGLGFQICDPEADSVEALLEKLGDSMIYYQIETPEETPFPEELDPFLPVTAGETIRAEETDGARLDLPWSMTYLIDLTDREG